MSRHKTFRFTLLFLLLLPLVAAGAPAAASDAGAPADAAPTQVTVPAPATPTVTPTPMPTPGGAAPLPLPPPQPITSPGTAAPLVPTPIAPSPAAAAGEGTLRMTELTVVGLREKQTTGSAHVLKSRELERFDYDDSQQVLKQIPGVYSRGEDGFGLRPNISIRGVNPDRSKKVTLMEDGVLFGPAPYSAPAAYYFPLVTRMDSVRVIKGPGAVSFGPQTVGGAIDFVTRAVPARLSAGLDLGAGQYRYGKADGHLGWSDRHLGFLLEGVHLRSDGFKELDGGDETGFQRNEIMGKGRWVPNPGGRIHNELQLKLGYSTEDSDETYLGLSDQDFRATPLRRYGSSQLDHMHWWRSHASLRHVADFGEGRSVQTTIYRQDFHRVWRKVNRLASSDIASVLANPDTGRNRTLMGVLTLDPNVVSDEAIFIGPNDRRFVSQGIATLASWRSAGAGWEQRLELGARLHYDHLDRVHSEDPFLAQEGKLVRGPGATLVTSDGINSATALALHALDAFTWGRLTLTPGVRFELIRTRANDRLNPDPIATDWQHVIVPGAGAHFGLTEYLGVLAGAYRGFSPVGPGQTGDVDPETSWNYEAGARAIGKLGRLEAVGFFNDYSNLLSQCTFASGCSAAQIDRQYNAGRAYIWGLEVFGQASPRPWSGAQLPLNLSYTLTRARFGSSFLSQDPQYGMVRDGDELPYVPRHQLAASVALETRWFAVQGAVTFTSEMREVAGQGPAPAGTVTDDSLVFEAGARAYVHARAHIYLHLRNLTDEHDLAARRPFGARPIAPRSVLGGVKLNY